MPDSVWGFDLYGDRDPLPPKKNRPCPSVGEYHVFRVPQLVRIMSLFDEDETWLDGDMSLFDEDKTWLDGLYSMRWAINQMSHRRSFQQNK